MARKLFADAGSSPISPLIDVVMNGMAAMFIILMIYMLLVQPHKDVPCEFVPNVGLPPIIRGQHYLFFFPVTGCDENRKFWLVDTSTWAKPPLRMQESNVSQHDISKLTFTLPNSLPEGLAFDSERGSIHGIVPVTDHVAGTIEVPLQVMVADGKNRYGDTRHATLKLHAAAVPYPDKALVINRKTENLPLGRVGEFYEEVLGALGGVEPYLWKVQKGHLPRGLKLEQGRVVGIPEETGIFAFDAEVSHTKGSFAYGKTNYSWEGETQQKSYTVETIGKLQHELRVPIGREDEPYFGMVLISNRLAGDRIVWNHEVEGLSGNGDSLEGKAKKSGTFVVSYEIRNWQDHKVGEGTREVKILPRRPEARVGPDVLQAWVGEEVSSAIPYIGMQEPVTITALEPLPEGLTITNNQITGKPVRSGMTSVLLKVEDSVGTSVNGQLGLRIGPRRTSLAIDGSDIVDIRVGHPVQWTPGVIGGEGVYGWEYQGQLPPGLQQQSHALTGTLQAPGEWPVTGSVKDQITGETVSRTMTLRGKYSDESRLQLVTTSVPSAIVGQPFETHMAAVGGIGIPRFQFQGQLPDGLVFSESGISGTPKNIGEAEFDVTVTDAVGQQDGPRRLKLLVEMLDRSQPHLLTAQLPLAVPGQKYVQIFSAEGGVGAYTWSFSGDLPLGLRFTAVGIEGTVDPQMRGTWTISATVHDEKGQSSSVNNLSLLVDDGWPELIVDERPLPLAVVGETYFASLVAHSCWGICRWTEEGLPNDLELKDGRIQGVPTKSGTYRVLATVGDERGRQKRGEYTLKVEESGTAQTKVSWRNLWGWL